MHTVRPLKSDEIAKYQALRLQGLEQHPEAFGESVDHFKSVAAEQILARLQETEKRGGFILVASDERNNLIGTIGLAVPDAEKMSHRGTIWGMFVSAGARRSGVGRMLLEQCLERASNVPALELVTLAVVTTNIGAFRLYQSCGFVSYGKDPSVLKIGEDRFDEFLMVKFLRDNTSCGAVKQLN